MNNHAHLKNLSDRLAVSAIERGAEAISKSPPNFSEEIRNSLEKSFEIIREQLLRLTQIEQQSTELLRAHQ